MFPGKFFKAAMSMAMTLSLLSACANQAAQTLEPTRPAQGMLTLTSTTSPAHTLTVSPSPTSSPIPSSTPSPLPTRTSSPTLSSHKLWTVQSPDLGEFILEYSPADSSIHLVSVEFTSFQCDYFGIEGTWRPSSFSGQVVNGQFKVGGIISGYMELNFSFPPGFGMMSFPDVTIEGSLTEAGELSVGTWEITWNEKTCSGNWGTSSQTAILPTEPAATAALPELYYLYPFCQCNEEIPAGQPSILRWGWLAADPEQVIAFTSACHTTLLINGTPYQGLDGLWSEAAYSQEDQAYKSLWRFPLPQLSAGWHLLEFSISLDQQVSDGYDSDGDGQLDLYGPGETFSGWVKIHLSEPSQQPNAACPNGAPAGHWQLIVFKESAGETTITLDGTTLTILSGENFIYLSAGQPHTILTGSITTSYTAAECEENILEIP